jgi:hypothetical protein
MCACLVCVSGVCACVHVCVCACVRAPVRALGVRMLVIMS